MSKARIHEAIEGMKRTLKEHPDIAGRTAQLLGDDPSDIELEALKAIEGVDMKRLNVDLPQSVIAAADALIERLRRDPEIRLRTPRVTRSLVLRLAVEEGLKILAQRYDHEA